SGGQRQRLALACALVGAPDILFLDEPTTGLDPQARLRIWEVVERFRGGGGTVVLTTHYMDEAARLADRVGIMDRGRSVALDTPAALIESLGADQIIELRTDRPLPAGLLEAVEGVRGVEPRGEALALRVERLPVTLPAVLAVVTAQGATVLSLATNQAT